MPEERKGLWQRIGDWANEETAKVEQVKAVNWDRQADWYKRAPANATMVKEYKDTERRKMGKEVAQASAHGWDVEEVTSQSGHINVGRTLLKGTLTLGLGYFTGASRTKGITVLRFTKRVPESAQAVAGGSEDAPDIVAQIEKLAELHTAGVLTDDEFVSKKRELLSRL